MRNHYGDIFQFYGPKFKVGDIRSTFNGRIILKVIDVDRVTFLCYAQAIDWRD